MDTVDMGPMKPQDGPIFSKLATDPDVAEVVEGFVESLASRIDRLQDLETREDHEELAHHAAELSLAAVKSGFGVLAECTSKIVEAARESDDDRLHEYMVALTEMSWRIRLGHRGAA